MDCQQYLVRFSEFFDGRMAEGLSREMEDHRSVCRRCRGYSETLEAGGELLRALPSLEVPEDFRLKLDHRILHVEDGKSMARRSLGTGATSVSVLAVAVLIALSAWAPTLHPADPAVALPPVVADPPVASFPRARVDPTFPRHLSLFSTAEFQDGIWGDSHDLLREYSPILDRRRDQALLRVGIE